MDDYPWLPSTWPCWPRTTCVHDLAGRLRCEKCKKAGKRPSATLLQVVSQARHAPAE